MVISATTITGSLAAVAALVALGYYRKQAAASTRDHLNNVHQLVFQRLDATEVREARHYVYALDTTVNEKGELTERDPSDTAGLTYENEYWLALGSPACPGSADRQEQWKKNRAKAELIARALDQLGYLVREGIVPLNVVARFYSYPTLRCWYQLSPYIAAIRNNRGQPGHMWEWENLVRRIIEGAELNRGIWKGTSDHDNLKAYATKIALRSGVDAFPKDLKWNPPDCSWTV
jgi:hypothetical protein